MNPALSLAARVHVPYPRATPVPGKAGLVVVGVRPHDGFPGLLLVWDEDSKNTGCSATNAIESLLPWLEREWDDFPLRECVIIERDSQGDFDHAYPEWAERGAMVLPLIQWKPLIWPGAPARTEKAFRGVFGSNALEALRAVHSLLAER